MVAMCTSAVSVRLLSFNFVGSLVRFVADVLYVHCRPTLNHYLPRKDLVTLSESADKNISITHGGGFLVSQISHLPVEGRPTYRLKLLYFAEMYHLREYIYHRER